MLTKLILERPLIGFSVLGFIGLITTVIGFSVLVADTVTQEDWGLVVYGLLMGVTGLIMLITIPLEVWLRRQRPQILPGHAPDGQAAMVVPRQVWTVVIGSTFTAALAVCALLGATLAILSGNWFIGVVLVVPGLWLGSYLVPVALGRVSAGGLYLSPGGIEHRRHASWWRVGWDDVVGVTRTEPVALILRAGAAPVGGRTTRWGWKGDVPAPDGVLGVQTRYLMVDGHALWAVLVFLLGRPDQRDELGTESSLRSEILDIVASDREPPI